MIVFTLNIQKENRLPKKYSICKPDEEVPNSVLYKSFSHSSISTDVVVTAERMSEEQAKVIMNESENYGYDWIVDNILKHEKK